MKELTEYEIQKAKRKRLLARNRDFDHQDAHNNHEFPHDHSWRIIGEYIDKDGQTRIRLERDEEPDPTGPDYINYPSEE